MSRTHAQLLRTAAGLHVQHSNVLIIVCICKLDGNRLQCFPCHTWTVISGWTSLLRTQIVQRFLKWRLTNYNCLSFIHLNYNTQNLGERQGCPNTNCAGKENCKNDADCPGSKCCIDAVTKVACCYQAGDPTHAPAQAAACKYYCSNHLLLSSFELQQLWYIAYRKLVFGVRFAQKMHATNEISPP